MALTKSELSEIRKGSLKRLRNPKASYSKKNEYVIYKASGGKLTYSQAIKGTKTTTKKRKAC